MTKQLLIQKLKFLKCLILFTRINKIDFSILYFKKRDGHEVAVAYFRSGYGPGDYPSDDEWKARYLVESSLAIKCPTIAYHLAGLKKVQQKICAPGIIERFLFDSFPFFSFFSFIIIVQ